MKKRSQQVKIYLLKKAKKGDGSWTTPKNHYFNRLMLSIQEIKDMAKE